MRRVHDILTAFVILVVILNNHDATVPVPDKPIYPYPYVRFFRPSYSQFSTPPGLIDFRPFISHTCEEKTILPGFKLPVCTTYYQTSIFRPPRTFKSLGSIDQVTTEKLLKMFSGLFYSPPQFDKARRASAARGEQRSHNGDMCCPTIEVFETAGDWMVDVNNELRRVLALPGHRQHYVMGICANESAWNCPGRCFQQKTFTFLLTLTDNEFGFSFVPFEVDAYCSCKNITP